MLRLEEDEWYASCWLNMDYHKPIILYSGKSPFLALRAWSGTVLPLAFRRFDFWFLNLFHVTLVVLKASPLQSSAVAFRNRYACYALC